LLHGIAQVSSLEANVILAGYIVDTLLRSDDAHAWATAIVEDVDPNIDGVWIIKPAGISYAQTYELFVLVISCDEDVDTDRSILLAAAVYGGSGPSTARIIACFPKVYKIRPK
jgi:hypothetical protein